MPSPLLRTFDYLPPLGCTTAALVPGVRVRVPFGRRQVVGVLIGTSDTTTIEARRLKRATEIIDAEPLLPPDLRDTMTWATAYYHHPPGEVMFTALPALLRLGQSADSADPKGWRLTDTGRAADPAALNRAPRQAVIVELLRSHPLGLTVGEFNALAPDFDWRATLRSLADKGWVATGRLTEPAPSAPGRPVAGPELNAGQRHAVQRVTAALQEFAVFFLDGVTGSGKTEVYLNVLEQVIAAGGQALVLVPEIGLTPQLVARFEERLGGALALYHSGLTDRERLRTWTLAASGKVPIVIGTRSAVFVPLQRPALLVIDEEHDPSFKQQDGFRYNARDLAVMRARKAGVPVILGSATPSLETLHNAVQGRYQRLELPERAGEARHPALRLLDMRRQPLREGLSDTLLSTVRQHLRDGNQVLMFLNRRGYAPTLLCHDCGWQARCERCDAHMTLHLRQHRLRCHHCGAERPVVTQCPDCSGGELIPVGHGTERIETVLQEIFPDVGLVRIDRDTTRRKGAMQKILAGVADGSSRILIGTQMLAKGHHLPDVTLVCILNADQGLFGADFRSLERMAQLIIQVAGRAGRADKPGEVLIQTHNPDHPLLQSLVRHGYHHFAREALIERTAAGLPPFTSLALLRAESVHADRPLAFLETARALAQALAVPHVELLGPAPAPMERRGGRYRAQLLIQAGNRADLHRLLAPWAPQLETVPQAKTVRWSLDVDPQEMI